MELKNYFVSCKTYMYVCVLEVPLSTFKYNLVYKAQSVFRSSFSEIKSATKTPASRALYKLWISVCLRADSHFPNFPF